MGLFKKAVDLIKAEDSARELRKAGKVTQADGKRVREAQKKFDEAKAKAAKEKK
jgi:hypothetical protein